MQRARLLAGAALAALILIAVLASSAILRHVAGGRADSDPLITELDRLRARADSCRTALSRQEASFMAYDSRVDSLRLAVRAHESADRTVPADQYGAYLDLFDEYNAAVPEWHARADSLRTSWDACRAVIEAHNVLADSAATLHRRPADAEAR